MATIDNRLLALQDEVSKLRLRVRELDAENNDFRELCNRQGIQYEEWLAVRRHRRYFEQLRIDHPIERTPPASDPLGMLPIARGIAEHAGSVLCAGMISRCFFSAFGQLTAQFPWRFGHRIISTLEGHEDNVYSLAVLEGGRLASGSEDRTIKIWELATSACVATLEGHQGGVLSLAVLEGERLASGSYDRTIKIWDSALPGVHR